MNEVAYRLLRVSGEDQKKGYGFDIQRSDIDSFCAKHNLVTADSHYREIEESSTTWDREKFEDCLEEVIELKHKGEVDWFVLPRVDRFARNLGAASYFAGKLLRNELKLGFARENIVVADEKGTLNLLVYLLYSFKADEDAKTIKANLYGGKVRDAQLGNYSGAPIPAGFVLNMETDNIEPYQPHKEVVIKVFEAMVDTWGSVNKAVKILRQRGVEFPPFEEKLTKKPLNMQSRSGLRRCPRSRHRGYAITRSLIRSILSNRVYLGEFKWGETKIENNHKLLISEELFKQANEALKSGYKPRGRRANESEPLLLANLLRCRKHNKAIMSHSTRGRYICQSDSESETNCLDIAHQLLDEPVMNTVLKALDISQYANEIIAELEESLTSGESYKKQQRSRKKEIEEHLSNLQWQLVDLKPGQEDRQEIYWRMINETQDELNRVNKELAKPIKTLFSNEEIQQVRRLLNNPEKIFCKMTPTLQNQLLKTLLKEVVITQNEKDTSRLHAHIFWNSEIEQEVYIIRPKTNRMDARWTQEEDDLLKIFYPKVNKRAASAALPERSWGAISGRAHHLGLSRDSGEKPGGKYKKWTKEDEDLLFKLYQTDMSSSEIVKRLGRSIGAIQAKAAQMGIKRAKEAKFRKAEFISLDGLVGIAEQGLIDEKNWITHYEHCS